MLLLFLKNINSFSDKLFDKLPVPSMYYKRPDWLKVGSHGKYFALEKKIPSIS